MAESFEAPPQYTADHRMTVELPPLLLEVFQDDGLPSVEASLLKRIPALWEAFMQRAGQGDVFDILELDGSGQTWEMELTFVSDDTMRRINGQYRGRDEATDVLSFTLLADSPVRHQLVRLPVVQLGSIFISPQWARTHTDGSGPACERFMLERLVHGWLHLLGHHHDTMEDYEQVVAIQKDVLDRI